MSLLEQSARDYTRLMKNSVPDGAGGSRTEWTLGEHFRAALALDTSMQARRAEQQGVTSLYSGLVWKGFPLQYGDYFIDRATGETWRVTSRPDEKRTPPSSALNLKCFTAERKSPPDFSVPDPPPECPWR